VKIKDVMTAAPRTCAADDNAATAAALMLDGDCGILPVLDSAGRIAGVVTDRDLYIALATRDVRASELKVAEVARRHVITCGPDDDVHMALDTMRQHQIRRLPVEGFGGTVIGIVSMNDILLTAGARKGVRTEEVVGVLQAIGAHHHPVPHIATV